MKKLLKYLKPYKGYIMAITVLVFIQVLTDLYLPTLMSDIVDKGIVQRDVPYIKRVGGYMLLIAGLGTICSIVGVFLSSRTSSGFGTILREKIFNKVESFSLNEFDKFGNATLITRTTNDVTQVQLVAMLVLNIMISAPLTGIGGIIMALKQDVKLSIVFVIVVPIIGIIIGIVLAKGVPLFRLMQVKLDKLNLVLRENLTGMRVVRAFNRVDYEEQRFEEANRDLMDNAIKVNLIMAALMPAMMVIMNFTTIAIIWFGAIRIDNGNMELGALMAFIQYAMQILFSFIMLSMLFIMVPRAEASAVRINEVLETDAEILDPEKEAEVSNIKGYVEFKEVTFSYRGAEQPALSNISFKSNPGEVTAIIGGTGAGKSTLINLIMRFYDVEKGSVLVDGVDVREMSQERLRSKIGFVPQKTELFSGSIVDNLKYGNEDADLDEINKAIKVSQAEDFVLGMEEGLEHSLSQGATNISGGQKQRLSIARALVRKPEIYIFDDSFSALDFKTDANLRKALKPEILESTVFIIAQRVSTVMDADRIIVLDDGVIKGMGTHKELINNCEVYKEILTSQLSEEELA